MTAVGRAGAGRQAPAEIVRADRSGGRADRSEVHVSAAYPEPEVEIPERPATPEEVAHLENELVAILADVLDRQRTIAA